MPVIEITDLALAKCSDDYTAGTKINPTQIVRAALLLLHQSKLNKDQFFSLIGQSATDQALIDAMEPTS